MTHDELLANIDKLTDQDYGVVLGPALRAVVELHKPERPPIGYKGDARLCKHCRKENLLHFAMHKSLRVEYPCPTIQAIEAELK